MVANTFESPSLKNQWYYCINFDFFFSASESKNNISYNEANSARITLGYRSSECLFNLRKGTRPFEPPSLIEIENSGPYS